MAAITITIVNHIEERGDGTLIEWPAYDLVANPGDIILANTDSEPDGMHYAVEQLDDAGAPAVIQFGAYYDPSVTPVPFVETGTPSGTFPLTLDGVSHTGTFSGPYAAIPPRVWDLDDEGLMWAERLGKISYNADPATGVYPITQESSTDPQIHSDHIHDDAVHHGKQHPSGPHRYHFEGLRMYFTGTDYIDASNPSVGFSGTLHIVPKHSTVTPRLVDSSGRTIHRFTGWSGQTMPILGSLRIVFNPSFAADYTPPGAPRAVSLDNLDGTYTWGPINPGQFFGIGMDVDLGQADGLLLYELGRADEVPDDDTGQLHFVSHHSGHTEFGGMHLAYRSVRVGKLTSRKDDGSDAPVNQVPSSDGNADGTHSVSWRDVNDILASSGGVLKAIHIPQPLPGGTDIAPDGSGKVTIGGRDGFVIVPDLSDPHALRVAPPSPASGTSEGNVMTWNQAADAWEPRALPYQAKVASGYTQVTADGTTAAFTIANPWPGGTFASAPRVVITPHAPGIIPGALVATGGETTSSFQIWFSAPPPAGNVYNFTWIATA
jgi:hypothetical protein